jgi:hypothetical protein
MLLSRNSSTWRSDCGVERSAESQNCEKAFEIMPRLIYVKNMRRSNSRPQMSPAPKKTLKEVQDKIAAIHQALSQLEYLCSGSLSKRTKLCSNPNCRCRTDRAARHGPYYEWGFMDGGRTRHRMLSPKRAELMRLAIGNYQKVKKLLKVWEEETVRLIELNVPE